MIKAQDNPVEGAPPAPPLQEREGAHGDEGEGDAVNVEVLLFFGVVFVACLLCGVSCFVLVVFSLFLFFVVGFCVGVFFVFVVFCCCVCGVVCVFRHNCCHLRARLIRCDTHRAPIIDT